MIKIQDLTPSVYYNQSRDFQLFGRLFEIVLNSVKTNSDMLYNLPFNENSDTKLLDLLTLTLGFKSNHNYNINQLKSLCGAFALVIRSKGSITAIQTAISALLKSEGIVEEPYIDIVGDETNSAQTTLELHIPEKLQDLNLLKDLLNYILPAGMSCNIVREARQSRYSTTNLVISNKYTKANIIGDNNSNTKYYLLKEKPKNWDLKIKDEPEEKYVYNLFYIKNEDGTYTENTSAEWKNNTYYSIGIPSKDVSIVPKQDQIGTIETPLIKIPLRAYPGVMSNSTIIMPDSIIIPSNSINETEEKPEEPLTTLKTVRRKTKNDK